MRRPLRVLFAAAEVSPVAKVGGLADVAGSLPKALARLGHEVRVIMPGYASIDRSAWAGARRGEIPVSAPNATLKATIVETPLAPGVPLYLLENEKYFARPRVYGEPDDLERFLFFSRALLEVPQRLSWSPDILHCHDWHAAPAVALLKAQKDPNYAACAPVLTIHNLAYQGWFDGAFFQASGMAAQGLPAPESQPGLGTMLGQAIYGADVVSTVSETYAREILTPEYGERLDPLLRQKEVWGIVNGIDYEVFNPATDPHLMAKFDASHLAARAKNKTALQERAGLPPEPSTPLMGMVTRIADQKGTDLVSQALDALFQQGPCQLVVLGAGEEKYVRPLAEAMGRHPGRAKLFLSFDPALAQLIYGGCDLFLMPSRFEPCGLGQLIALRYGAIPVARRTGGLADTVQDCSPDLKEGNGFLFEEYSVPALLGAIERAMEAFRKSIAWRQLQRRAMAMDFSWEASARKYEAMYHHALRRRQEA